MYFCINETDRYYEKLMVGIPNFKPREYGIGIISLTVTANTPLTRKEMLLGAVKNIRYPPFLRRFNKFMNESEQESMKYKNQKHRDEFESAVSKRNKKDNRLMSAVYLLTADLKLWNVAKRHISKTEIDFTDIKPKNIDENGYTLFCCAKDLYLGTKHLSISDLADTELIPPKTFGVICNAMAIRRYGLNAISYRETIGTSDRRDIKKDVDTNN